MKRMLLVSFLMSVGATFVTPLFPLYSETYEMNSLEITILFAIYATFLLPSLLIIGVNSTRWGLKRIVRISIWLSILSTLIFLVSANDWMLYLARIMEGIAYGAFTGSAAAYLILQTSPDRTQKAIKLSGVAILSGFGFGPAIAGGIIEYSNLQPLRFPYGILLALLIISLILLETLPKDAVTGEQRKSNTKVSLGLPKKIRSPFVSMAGLPIFTVFTIQGIVFSLIPTFVKSVIQTSNLAVSGMIIFVLLIGAVLAQFIPWLSHPVKRIRIGILLLLTGAWIIVASGIVSNLPLLWVGIILQAMGGGWTFQIALTFAGQLPNPVERPRVISIFYLFAYSGFIFPVVGVGLLSLFLDLHFSLIILNIFVTLIAIYVLKYSEVFSRHYSHLGGSTKPMKNQKPTIVNR